MVGAVGERHGHIDHREPAERPTLQVVRHADLDGGDELARHYPSRDLLGKLKARATWQGLDVDDHVAELTVPARRLLVSAADLDPPADGFLVRHLARFGDGLYPVLAL